MKTKGICAIITGAAEGIGRAVAERLLEKEAKFVAVLDVNKTKEKTAKDLREKFGKERVQYFHCNVTKDEDIKRAFKQAYDINKRVDVIVNNAGVPEWHPDILQINLGSVITGSELAKDYLSKTKSGYGGVLINTASILGLFPLGYTRYVATKFGVVGLTLSLPLQDSCFSPDDVRVGAICPGFVETNLSKEVADKVNFIKMDQVVDAFLLMIEDDTKHNCCIRITPKLGIDFHPLTPHEQFLKLTGILKD